MFLKRAPKFVGSWDNLGVCVNIYGLQSLSTNSANVYACVQSAPAHFYLLQSAISPFRVINRLNAYVMLETIYVLISGYEMGTFFGEFPIDNFYVVTLPSFHAFYW